MILAIYLQPSSQTFEFCYFRKLPKLMRFIITSFILLFSCISFCSYGKDSSPNSDTLAFFKKQFHSRSKASNNILFTGASYHYSFTSPILSNSRAILLYQESQQPSTVKISFQSKDLTPAIGIFPAIRGNFKIPPIKLHDSFLSRPSNVPMLRNEHAGIWKKIGRAELFIGGVELIGMTVLICLPKEVTKWPDDWAQDAWRNLKRSFSIAPVWDKDDWQLNYIGHPIAGSYYYNALRSQNASRFHSFLFSTAQSFIWEYLIEGMAERPSTQDLIITPVVGSILGEATHIVTMSMRRNGFNFFEKVFVLLLNPMFVINNGFGPKYNPAFARR